MHGRGRTPNQAWVRRPSSCLVGCGPECPWILGWVRPECLLFYLAQAGAPALEGSTGASLAMLGMSETEKIAGLAPDMQGLLDQRGVAKDLQAGLYDLGITNLAMLSAVAMDRKGLEGLAKASLGVDSETRPTDAVRFATLFLAWQSAKKRITVRDEQDAEAEVQRAPKPIPGVELQLYRAEFQKRFYKLKDAECPGKPSFEDLCEQMDAGELRAMSLRHFGSRNEDDDAETGNIQLGKSGTLKIKKAKVETANPGNLEEFRTKVMLMINHFIFARFRFPNKEVLSDITPFTALEYLNYICSKDVAQMESQSVEGVTMHRPSLKLIIHYEYQMRKEAMDLVNKGTKLGEALRQVTKDSDVRERHFSTPLAVSSATQALQQDPWHQRQKGGDRQHPYEVPFTKGKIKGKGKGKGKKGKNKHRSGGLHGSTPDGRQICFAFNNEGCSGSCGRVHVCRICLDPGHSMAEHPEDPKQAS